MEKDGLSGTLLQSHTREVEAGESAQDQPCLHFEFQDSLGYVRPCLNIFFVSENLK